MAILCGTIAILLLLSPITSAAYIGFDSDKLREITDDEMDRSLVPMIRIPRDEPRDPNPLFQNSFEIKDENDVDETLRFGNEALRRREISEDMGVGRKQNTDSQSPPENETKHVRTL